MPSSEPPLIQAKALLLQAKTASCEQLPSLAVPLARLMLEIGQKQASLKERFTSKMMAAMMDDPIGKYFMTCLMDRFFRSRRFRSQWHQFHELKTRIGIPSFLPSLLATLLESIEKIAGYAPSLSTIALQKVIRWQTQEVISNARPFALKNHLKARRKQHIRINLNHLGEAILGEKEAAKRLDTYLQDLKNPLIEYISVKISTLYSQINPLDKENTLSLLQERLGQLYQVALEHPYVGFDGQKKSKFVNLDMEEYGDLELTLELFVRTLSEPRFRSSRSGIVLQSYLPDSWSKLQTLIAFAKERQKQAGMPIKIRLVKGANLAMEQLQARLKGWPQAPYSEKALVDANFKRMLLAAAQSTARQELILGVGSHNLFDVCYTLLLRAQMKIEDKVELEMLEGMAPQIRRAIQSLSQDMLLYCPVATQEEFASAIAYLVRRLDENTGPENFLRHFFHLDQKPEIFDIQAKAFEKSFSLIPSLTQDSMRHPRALIHPSQDFEAFEKAMEKPFMNEPDTDWSCPKTVSEMLSLLKEQEKAPSLLVPCVIQGNTYLAESGNSLNHQLFEDPSKPGFTAFKTTLASWEMVDHALESAKKASTDWSLKKAGERARILFPLAHELRLCRGPLITLMVATCAKRIEEADAEVSEAIDFVEYYCHQALELEQIEHLKLHSRGVAFVAPPWNFPLAIALGSLVGALLTGHSVLFKPAPMAAAVGYTLAQMVWKIGISKQVLQFICLDEQEVGSRLLKDPRVDIACLTGSSETARLFLKWAPSRPLIAETGGKNVIIISNTCDRDLAIKDLLQSAFSHSGQKCSAASLTILHEELYRDPKFWQQLIDAASSLHVGSSWDTASKITPLLMTDDPKLVWALTELEEGQEWVLKPKQDPKNPRLWSPGLVKGVKKGSRRHEEEFFGPVLGFMPYRHLSEAIEIANQTPYGLTCGLYTLSEEEQDLWSRQMLAGNLYVNRPITGALVHRQPFGGTKASRIGQGKKAGGPHYLLSFYAPGDSKPDHYQIRYPEKLSQILCLASSEIALELEPIFKSYSYWYLHFTREIDPVRIPGQDNFYFLKAQEDYLIRWEKEEGNEKDFWCALAAACLCQAKVIVSAKAWPGKKEPPAFIEFYSAGQQWLDTWKKYSLQTVRFIGKPTHETLEKLAHLNITSLLDPVCYHGRYELLHPLREVSFCRDYHRYGNLGLQSHQTPHP